MMDFRAYDEEVANAALSKMLRHLWYLTEELVVFVLFSDNPEITCSLKREMGDKIISTPKPDSFRLGRPIFKSITRNTTLIDLVGPDSWFLFETLGSNGEWLYSDVGAWQENDEYLRIKSFVQTVKVVNDPAERAVKLSTECSVVITDDEEQRSALMQAIEQHRQQYPDSKKVTLRKK